MSFAACLVERRRTAPAVIFFLPEPAFFAMDGLSPMHPDPVEEAERWMLEDRYGKRVPLRKNAMLFLGREECDILLKSKSVDGQHAVLVFDEYVERFKVKDLSSINGTFVNESRIPEDTYVYVEHADTLRFGYDSMVYRVLAASRCGESGPGASAANGALSPLGRRQREPPPAAPPPSAPAAAPTPAPATSKPSEIDLPSWAAKEIDHMESPLSCLEDQLLLPGVVPPIMAECSACMAENRMECHDGEIDLSPTPRPAPPHTCGFSPLMAAPRVPRCDPPIAPMTPPTPPPSRQRKETPPTPPPSRQRQETPPCSLALSGRPKSAALEDRAILSDLEILSLASPSAAVPYSGGSDASNASSATAQQLNNATTAAPAANQRAFAAMSPTNRRKSIKAQELYGQPAWWGEDDGDVYSYPHTSRLVGTDVSRPPKHPPPAQPREPPEPLKVSTAPAPAPAPVAPLTPTKPAEAFTVVFDDVPTTAAAAVDSAPEEPPPPAVPPLSQFVPSKIRKSFQQREQKRKPLDKSKSDGSVATGRSSAPSRAVTGRSSAGPSGGSRGASRAFPPAPRPSSASPRADALLSAKRPPKAPKTSSARAGGPVRPGKEAAGQSSPRIPPSSRTANAAASPAASDCSLRANLAGKLGRTTDKAKSSSMEKLKSYTDSKSYLFDRMFTPGGGGPPHRSAATPSPPTVSPLRPQNRISPKHSPVDTASPLPLSPDFVTSPRSQNGGEADREGSDAGTYTIERESEEYEAARKVDLSLEGVERGRADGDEKTQEEEKAAEEQEEQKAEELEEERKEVAEVEEVEEREEEEKRDEREEEEVEDGEEEEEDDLQEPLSVSEAMHDWDSDEVEQEQEIDLKTSNGPKWLSDLSPQQQQQQPPPPPPQQQQQQPSSAPPHAGMSGHRQKNGKAPNGDLGMASEPVMPHAASSASLNSMPPMAMDGSGEFQSHRAPPRHHTGSLHHPRRHSPRQGGTIIHSGTASTGRQHKSTHHLAYEADQVSPTCVPVHRTGSSVSLQLPPYSSGASNKYPPSSSRSARYALSDISSSTSVDSSSGYNAMAVAYQNHQLQQHHQHQQHSAHVRSASGSLSRKAADSIISDCLSSARSTIDNSDLDLMSSSMFAARQSSLYQQPPPPTHPMSVPPAPAPIVAHYSHSTYPHPRHGYHRLSYHEPSGYSLMDSRLPHDTAGLLQDTEDVLNDMQHRVMLSASATTGVLGGGGHRGMVGARTAGSMDCIPYADDYVTDDDTLSSGGCSAPAGGGANALYGGGSGGASAAAKRHPMSAHHYHRSSLEGVRRGSLPPSPGEATSNSNSAFRSPRSVGSGTGDGGSTKRSLGSRIVQKSRENMQASQAAGSSSSSSSSSTTVAPTVTSQAASTTASPGSDPLVGGAMAPRLEYGRHSLKLPAAPGPAYSPSAAVKPSPSPRSGGGTSSWQRRKDFDARKAAAVARQSSSGSLSSSGGHVVGPESGSSAGGSMESADPEIVGAKMTRTATELSKDLEILARREDLSIGGRHSAFSPLQSSPESPGGPLGIGVANNRTPQLPHGGFRSRSAAVLNDACGPSQSYDGLMASSILHLSTKLRRCSNEILHKMRKCRHLSRTPSPVDECFNHAGYSQINQELSESLNNLKAVEYQMQVMERALFPQAKSGRSSALGSCTEGEYLLELERINHELQGFTPIDAPISPDPSDSAASVSVPFVVAPQPLPTSSAAVTAAVASNGGYGVTAKSDLYY